jgi:hypothetical protein
MYRIFSGVNTNVVSFNLRGKNFQIDTSRRIMGGAGCILLLSLLILLLVLLYYCDCYLYYYYFYYHCY